MTPEEIVRAAHRDVERELLETKLRIREERLAAYAEEKPSPADLIGREWDELDAPFADFERYR